MKKLSHATRANFINSSELNAFLERGIVNILRKAHEEGALEKVTKYMEVDMKALLRTLESMPTNKEKEEHLASRCPCLFVFVMKQRKNIDALAEYMAKC